ncbi:MAG: SOS response-associated peptidase family protein [Butyrivibrio sp.]|nr:SOS response-associated peptidase family protein [Butyrivibrio sp.]
MVEEDLELDMGSFDMLEGDFTPAMAPVVLTAVRNSAGEEDRDATGEDKSADQGNGIRVTNMFWGLEGKDKKLVINARAESALDKQMFADSMAHRRCVMPAEGFYEWDRDKNKVTFYRSDKRPIYLAGFYGMSNNRDSFVILTTKANESMIKVHDRMPLMIEKGRVRDWLYDIDAAKEMLAMDMPLLESKREYEQLSLF